MYLHLCVVELLDHVLVEVQAHVGLGGHARLGTVSGHVLLEVMHVRVDVLVLQLKDNTIVMRKIT